MLRFPKQRLQFLPLGSKRTMFIVRNTGLCRHPSVKSSATLWERTERYLGRCREKAMPTLLSKQKKSPRFFRAESWKALQSVPLQNHLPVWLLPCWWALWNLYRRWRPLWEILTKIMRNGYKKATTPSWMMMKARIKLSIWINRLLIWTGPRPLLSV